METLLDASNLSKRYGSVLALNQVSLSVRTGEVVGLIGPNGAGKSTLIGILSGAIAPTSGEILFCGRSIARLRSFQRGELGIARTFQLVQPFQRLTSRECVMLGVLFGSTQGRNADVSAARKKADLLLDLVGLRDKSDVPSELLNVPERKKLELARAIAVRPRLLLIDEVMAGLSNAEMLEMVRIIQELRTGGVTVVVIEHVVQAIRDLADRVVVLHHGEKIADGILTDVFSQDLVLENYLGHAR